MSVHSLDGTTVPSSQDLEALASTPVLAEHAAAIKTLGRRVVTDVIEIGHRLTESRNICGHGYWLPWLDREFGWSDKTAENFINVYKLSSKFENFSNLNLPLSGLYLLAAPSTPPEARDQIIEQAKAGKSVPVAEIKKTIAEAKGHKVLSFVAAFRAEKLGEETIAKLKGTSLDNARELDELVILNRGAASGELTDIVRQLVEAAAGGKAVSAIAYTKSGAAFRREGIGVANSTSECESLRARIDEQQTSIEHFVSQCSELRRQVKDLEAKQKPFAPDTIATLSDAELTEALVALGFERFLQVMPAEWRLKLGPRASGQKISRAKVRHPNKTRLKRVGGSEASPSSH
jgi:Protein of unknown function (DUF3102)